MHWASWTRSISWNSILSHGLNGKFKLGVKKRKTRFLWSIEPHERVLNALYHSCRLFGSMFALKSWLKGHTSKCKFETRTHASSDVAQKVHKSFFKLRKHLFRPMFLMSKINAPEKANKCYAHICLSLQNILKRRYFRYIPGIYVGLCHVKANQIIKQKILINKN